MFETSNTVRIPVTGSDRCSHLECSVYYKLGGYNVFSYRAEPRGYYVSVTPVIVDGNMICYDPLSGLKRLVKEVARRSAKADREAASVAESVLPDLVRSVCARNRIAPETVDLVTC